MAGALVWFNRDLRVADQAHRWELLLSQEQEHVSAIPGQWPLLGLTQAHPYNPQQGG